VPETTVETINTLLESALEMSDDPEVNYKIRTALQLLYVGREEHEQLAEALETADVDDDLRETLTDLGYLE
jgi:hypothetical protein